MIGREGPGPERPGPDYPPEWDQEPEEELTRQRGECLSGDPQQWCRWNPECRSCAPVAGSVHAVTSDPWAAQGPVPPPPF